MSKLFLCSHGEPFDIRFTGKAYKVFAAESADEALRRYRPRLRTALYFSRPEWLFHAVEITEEVLKRYPWVKNIPVSP